MNRDQYHHFGHQIQFKILIEKYQKRKEIKKRQFFSRKKKLTIKKTYLGIKKTMMICRS